MGRVLVTNGRSFFSRLTNGRLPGAAREDATMDVPAVQPSGGASTSAADLDQRADSLDAASGSEFVDDRIRLRE
jgi:hypothetical protein